MTNELKSVASKQQDLETLHLAQAGNEEALSAIFETHKSKIYSICLRMCGNPAEADDLTQDAFLQIFRKIGAFREESALSTWLHRVAVNTVLMNFRKKRLRQVSMEDPVHAGLGAPRREYGKVDDRLKTSVDRVALARAMQELPPGYRTVFLMHEVKGYDHREIARLLSCSVGNSKSQLHRAKARMRELLC